MLPKKHRNCVTLGEAKYGQCCQKNIECQLNYKDNSWMNCSVYHHFTLENANSEEALWKMTGQLTI